MGIQEEANANLKIEETVKKIIGLLDGFTLLDAEKVIDEVGVALRYQSVVKVA